eukprot:1369374-Prymnesium_polylepis.1
MAAWLAALSAARLPRASERRQRVGGAGWGGRLRRSACVRCKKEVSVSGENGSWRANAACRSDWPRLSHAASSRTLSVPSYTSADSDATPPASRISSLLVLFLKASRPRAATADSRCFDVPSRTRATSGGMPPASRMLSLFDASVPAMWAKQLALQERAPMIEPGRVCGPGAVPQSRGRGGSRSAGDARFAALLLVSAIQNVHVGLHHDARVHPLLLLGEPRAQWTRKGDVIGAHSAHHRRVVRVPSRRDIVAPG